MNKFKKISIDQLAFDKENPRLPDTVDRTKEGEIIKYLALKTGIESLMISIGQNNFFDGEAIVVTPAPNESEKYIVLEGNRRLAALRLLQNPTLIGDVSSIKGASEGAEHRPQEIPAYVVNSRESALQYLGFRHISGVQRWDPLAKARYLKLVFNQAIGEPEECYLQVAREIGSKRNAVRRNLDALAAYNAIRAYDFYEIPELDEENFQFGVFYTALGDIEIASFVGIKKDGVSTHPIVNPECLKKQALQELTDWMFRKDDHGDTRLGESRNIGKLSAVIANSNALEKLRQGVPLDIAYSATSESKNKFLYDINQAIYHLRQANSNLDSVSSEHQQRHQQAVKAVREMMGVLDVAIEYLRLKRDG